MASGPLARMGTARPSEGMAIRKSASVRHRQANAGSEWQYRRRTKRAGLSTRGCSIRVSAPNDTPRKPSQPVARGGTSGRILPQPSAPAAALRPTQTAARYAVFKSIGQIGPCGSGARLGRPATPSNNRRIGYTLALPSRGLQGAGVLAPAAFKPCAGRNRTARPADAAPLPLPVEGTRSSKGCAGNPSVSAPLGRRPSTRKPAPPTD